MQLQGNQRPSLRLLGRSYMAFVLTPEDPAHEWLGEIDSWIARSPKFFAGRPVVLDLSGSAAEKDSIQHLIGCLMQRGIRVMALEGADASLSSPDLPPLLTIERSSNEHEKAAPASTSGSPAERKGAKAPRAATSLMLDSTVRSGQSVVFLDGDVTVLGSVSSGAEIVAGGSVHIYGALRGRVMAGAAGNPRARIFCHKIEAELLAINGCYRTAEDIERQLHTKPIQAWLEGDAIRIAALN